MAWKPVTARWTSSGVAEPRAFQVLCDLTATQATRIEGSGQLDTVLLGYPPVWTQLPDSVTYQWYRGSTAVGDGGLSYTVTAADLGQQASRSGDGVAARAGTRRDTRATRSPESKGAAPPPPRPRPSSAPVSSARLLPAIRRPG